MPIDNCRQAQAVHPTLQCRRLAEASADGNLKYHKVMKRIKTCFMMHVVVGMMVDITMHGGVFVNS